ncbi:phosphodiesterase [Haloprofundus marisrubri]|uniref:Phosphodiesterase n=1 Tax=Haloprofundus marisrubri TaxID=1514971 RepID=A0A0W1R3A9_9EURY|nr:alkaline phosphatase family protein [Haloprofundus marisrubri]KTG07832.1 phosphodiesterase [Haloprofundus marisrubri]
MHSDSSTRAFVLGLDGVPWGMLQSWIDDGHLPNFKRLTDEGASGSLESTRPASTPLAWPSIATGVWPDKHGLYDFQRLTEDYRREMYTSSDLSRPALWEMLSPSVVANVPMTYPATNIDGKMVTGMLTPGFNDRFTSPQSLSEEIQDEIPDYIIGMRYADYHNRKDEFPDAIENLATQRRKLLSKLMKEDDWRLFFFVFTAPDRLQHLIWDEETLLTHYRLLDTILGDVLRYVEEREANLYVVSDHGFGPIDQYACANTLLEQEGFLVRKQDKKRGALQRFGLTKQRIEETLGAVNLDIDTVARHLPDRFVDSVADQVPGDHALYDADFSKTEAFVHGSGHVFINAVDRFDEGIVPRERVPEVKARLMDLFENYTDPKTGDHPFEVFDGDEIYDDDEQSADIVLEGQPGYEVRASLSKEVCIDSSHLEASHRPEGIFFAWGENIAPGATVDGATVVDVAPTLLHALGEPVPEGTDGRVLLEAFESESEAASRSVEYAPYSEVGRGDAEEEDFSGVEDRLKGLGYME